MKKYLEKRLIGILFAAVMLPQTSLSLMSENVYIAEPGEGVGGGYTDISVPLYTEAEVELIARLTLAEAEGESELGKRLVIDTVLNRIDSEHFPDTVYDVIFEPWQFTPVSNGRLDECEARDDIVALVYEEIDYRTDSECVFFQTGWYSPWGIDLYKEGGHYFSKCKYD